VSDRELLGTRSEGGGDCLQARQFILDARRLLRVLVLRRPMQLRCALEPTTDDGDALRLAVKLGLHISQQLSYVAVMQPHGGAGSHLLQWIEKYNNDPYAATRRVITRAAAEIGRNMK
jgi:hypothetical protein